MTTATVSNFVTQEEIERNSKFGQEHGAGKDRHFGILYLSKKFKIPVNEAALFVATGKDTGIGIDAYYHDREKKILYLYTFRCSPDHKSFKEPLEKRASNGISTIF